jgi:hypothetical protein
MIINIVYLATDTGFCFILLHNIPYPVEYDMQRESILKEKIGQSCAPDENRLRCHASSTG